MKSVVILALLGFACLWAPVVYGEGRAPEIVELPLPQGQKMEFVLVRVAESDSPFASVQFRMGKDLQSDYDERMTTASVSGTVYVPAHDGQAAYWAIPMGRTEVTRAQYAAIMSPDSMPEAEEAQLPQVNVSYAEVQAYIAALNKWCLEDKTSAPALALKKLSESKLHGVPYVRLPLESEWEFAARGGGFVSAEALQEDVPYADVNELQGSENIYIDGREKLRPVGYKRVCNPSGLFDMFGNVREMVDGVFRPEYHFGRIGGLLIRGGSYVDQYVTSYTRREVAPFSSSGAPFRSAQVGFRLALGSTILSGVIKGERLSGEWSEYVETMVAAATPGSSPTDSLETALENERRSIVQQLGSMADQMAALTGKNLGQNDLNKLENMLSSMNSQMKEMEKKVSLSQETSAQAALQMLYFSSAEALKNSAATALELRKSQLSALSPEAREVFRNNARILQENVPTFWNIFTKGCAVLKDVSPKVVDEQINLRIKEIDEAGALSKEKRAQKSVFMTAIKHFRKYLSTGRLSSAEREIWYQEISQLNNQPN